MPTPTSIVRRLAAPAALALTLLVAAPAPAAQLDVEGDGVEVLEVGSANGLLDAGDVVELRTGIRSAEPGTRTGITGELSLASGGTMLQDSSSFPDLAFGDRAENLTPFRAQLSDTLACGAPLPFSLGLAAGPDTAQVPLRVGTGVAGAPQRLGSVDVPHPIPNPGLLVSTLAVGTPGRVKDVRVRLDRITHPYVADLTLTLVSPSGTRVRLVQAAGGAGDDFVGTIIAADGPSLAGAVAPFTGTYAAHGDLRELDGEPMQGTWRLELLDGSPADLGGLVAWGLELSPATCAPRLLAAFTATPQTVAPGGVVTFDASSSADPNDEVVAYAWDLDGDGSFETDGGSSPTLVRTFGERGSVDVGLRVTDDTGETDTTTRRISVTQAPTAALTATPDDPATGEAVVLDASGSSDPDGEVARYAFDLDADGTFELDGTLAARTVTFDEPGPRTVRVRVTDDDGATSIAAAELVVANRAPTARLVLPGVAVLGVPATFDAGGSSDEDGTIDHFDWDVDGDGDYDVSTQGPTLTRTFASPGTPPGTRTIRVRAVDDLGAGGTTSGTLRVTFAPVADLTASPSTPKPGAAVQLSAAGSSDADGTVAGYAWDLDGNGSFETDGGATATRTTSFSQEGAHTVRVRVTDDAGATATASASVLVVNLRPVVVLGATATSIVTGFPVTFDAAGSADPDGALERFEWDLDGNGSYETDGGGSPSVTRSYPNPAAFDAGVRVTDDDGGTSEARLPIVVLAAPDVLPPVTPNPNPSVIFPPTKPGATSAPTTPTPSVPAGPAGGGGTGARGAAAFAAALEGAAIQTRRAVLKRGLALGCVADRAASCAMTAEIGAADARRLGLTRGRAGKRPYVLGRTTLRLAAAGRAPAVVRLPAKARRALKPGRRVLVVVRAVASDAAGKRLALTRAVLVR